MRDAIQISGEGKMMVIGNDGNEEASWVGEKDKSFRINPGHLPTGVHKVLRNGEIVGKFVVIN